LYFGEKMADEKPPKATLFSLELKDFIMIGGVLVSLTLAYANLKSGHDDLDGRVDKLEKLELGQLAGRVDRLSCKIGQLRQQLQQQPLPYCSE
jgi:hypothetical protein